MYILNGRILLALVRMMNSRRSSAQATLKSTEYQHLGQVLPQIASAHGSGENIHEDGQIIKRPVQAHLCDVGHSHLIQMDNGQLGNEVGKPLIRVFDVGGAFLGQPARLTQFHLAHQLKDNLLVNMYTFSTQLMLQAAISIGRPINRHL